jgi:hypothetical protein
MDGRGLILAGSSPVRRGPSLMILPKSNRLTPEQVAEITAIVGEFGCSIQPIVGAVRTIYAIVGDERDELMINRLEGLPTSSGSTGSSRPSSSWTAGRTCRATGSRSGGVTLGEELAVIAGPVHDRPEEPQLLSGDGGCGEGGGRPRPAGRRLEAADQPLRLPGRQPSRSTS